MKRREINLFWDILIAGIKNGYIDDLYLLIMFVSLAAMIHLSFDSKRKLKYTLLIWSGMCLALVLSIRLFYAIQYTIFYTYEDFFVNNSLAYNIFYNFGIWIFLIQVILLLVGAKLTCNNSMKMMGFAILLMYMYVSLLADYLMPLLLVALNPQVTENGYYIEFEKGGGLLYLGIGATISILLYIVYRRYLKSAMSILLSLSEEHYGKLTLIPFLSYITYSIFYLLMGYVGVYPYMPEGILYFVLVFASIIVIYATMYLAMFYGIFSAVKTTRIKAELDVASRIQSSNLPKVFKERKDLSICALMDTAFEVGGDFYDYFFIDDDHLAVVIADVSGKGVPAALFMMMAKTLIKNNSSYQYSPSDILMHVNNQLYTNNASQMFVTVFMGILEISTGKFCYANAGHNRPIIYESKGDCNYLKSKNGLVLAGMQNVGYQDQEIIMKAGDRLFLYTDGLTEAINKKYELYGEHRLLELWKNMKNINISLAEIPGFIKNELSKFTNGANQEDDITMLLLQYNGSFIPNRQEKFIHVGIMA